MNEHIMGQASLQAVEGGFLKDCRKEEGAWLLEFSGGLKLECYCPWRLLQKGAESRTLIGSRDLELHPDPLASLAHLLEGYQLNVLHFSPMHDSFQLGLLKGAERVIIDVLKDSAEKINWKVVGDDFEDSDSARLIENL